MSETKSNINDSSNERSWINKFATDAFILGALSAAGYCFAFAYEAGYARHFGYPYYLISPTPSVIVIALGTVLGVAIVLYPVSSDIFIKSAPKKDKTIAYILTLIIISVVIALYLYLISYNNIFVPFIALISTFGTTFLWWKSTSYTGKSSYKSVSLFLTVGIVVYGAYAAFSVKGIIDAQNEKVFYFIKSKPEYAVVRLYDSILIAVRFDFKENVFTQDYYVMKIGDDKKDFELKRIIISNQRDSLARNDSTGILPGPVLTKDAISSKE